jgi:hypothetical protein
MEFKRIYDKQDLERYKAEHEAALAKWQELYQRAGAPQKLIETFARQSAAETVPAPALAGVELVHTGARAEQNFSTSLITEFVKLGVATIDGNQLTLHTSTEDLRYAIVREPGRWCLHCKEKLSDDENGELARLHVALKHKDKPSPDATVPAGYVWLKYFECVLDKKQHAQFKRVAG